MRGNMGNMQGMMKQMQKMQKQIEETQEVLNQTEYVGAAANDLVMITMTGDKKVVDVKVKVEAVDPDDVEMLQDLILMATNDALEKVETDQTAKLGKFAKGMPGF
ncbi:YbaB/EbfC family nucleoid-associated protein [Jeotgalibaca ciconiae]|uniref:Nucleoid-associated protein EJN90_05430 n=1 Tax=Jeotgalibaca ciconiae TaxID=2496265 RepID=A0A3S9H9U4_9LACT|nr:YbaB/EbfC family nucleoid-associated protein [Jeotgalibaca ciconiae]AZP04156.1 YbaB/EbfC family nucleoid-associated protein [Jeotgalibaca ciconiae]HJB22787.1 YbaB/EbfC family nucleoid-associated protein [Candidatus Jeotgalibaca pullicola]